MLGKALLCLVLESAVILTLTPRRVLAQERTSISTDAMIGGGAGKGGAFYHRAVGGPRLGVSIRRWHTSEVGAFGEVSMDWLRWAGLSDAVCPLGPDGVCLEPYPLFAGPTAVVGVIARRADRRLEARAGLGGGAYAAAGRRGGDASGPRVGVVVGQVDVAAFPAAHFGLVAGGRWVVVPRYRGDRLSIVMWMVGVRLR